MKGDLQLSRQTAWEGRGGMPAPGDRVSGVLAGGGSVLPEAGELAGWGTGRWSVWETSGVVVAREG